MNILITGCAGFIGSNLADKLSIDKNNLIIGLDNFDNTYPEEVKLENLSELNGQPNFQLIKGDIRDSLLLNKIFSENNIDIVIHLAAKAGVRTSFEIPEEYKSVNIEGTETILKIMAKYGVQKLVFASSSSVYGNCKSPIFNEKLENLKPISPYAQTKLMCEKTIREYSEKYGIQAICLRFFTVYGKRQRPDLAIHKFTKQIFNNETVTIYGDGTTYRDYTHIEDIINGIIASINYNKTPFEIINLGSSSPIILNDMVKYIEKALNKDANIKHFPPQNGDVNRTFADITKARNLLGYEPQIKFIDGLNRFVQEFVSREKQNAK